MKIGFEGLTFVSRVCVCVCARARARARVDARTIVDVSWHVAFDVAAPSSPSPGFSCRSHSHTRCRDRALSSGQSPLHV